MRLETWVPALYSLKPLCFVRSRRSLWCCGIKFKNSILLLIARRYTSRNENVRFITIEENQLSTTKYTQTGKIVYIRLVFISVNLRITTTALLFHFSLIHDIFEFNFSCTCWSVASPESRPTVHFFTRVFPLLSAFVCTFFFFYLVIIHLFV